jgi:hypothetical protein
MKKMFALLTAVIIAAGAWASPSPAENAKAKAAFEKEFNGAKDVQWSGSEEVSVVSFVFNNEIMRAWFTAEGEIAAIQRNVKKEQMTYLSAKSLEKLQEEQTVLRVVEMNKEGDMYYLVKAENRKFESLYKLTPSGVLTRIEKKKIKN